MIRLCTKFKEARAEVCFPIYVGVLMIESLDHVYSFANYTLDWNMLSAPRQIGVYTIDGKPMLELPGGVV